MSNYTSNLNGANVRSYNLMTGRAGSVAHSVGGSPQHSLSPTNGTAYSESGYSGSIVGSQAPSVYAVPALSAYHAYCDKRNQEMYSRHFKQHRGSQLAQKPRVPWWGAARGGAKLASYTARHTAVQSPIAEAPPAHTLFTAVQSPIAAAPPAHTLDSLFSTFQAHTIDLLDSSSQAPLTNLLSSCSSSQANAHTDLPTRFQHQITQYALATRLDLLRRHWGEDCAWFQWHQVVYALRKQCAAVLLAEKISAYAPLAAWLEDYWSLSQEDPIQANPHILSSKRKLDQLYAIRERAEAHMDGAKKAMLGMLCEAGIEGQQEQLAEWLKGVEAQVGRDVWVRGCLLGFEEKKGNRKVIKPIKGKRVQSM